ELRAQKDLVVTTGPLTPNTVYDHINVLIIRSKTIVNRRLIEKLPNLQCIISCTSGFDHIFFEELVAQKNLLITHTPQANTQSATELTWALLLAVLHRLPGAHRQLTQGIWERDYWLGEELTGKVMGIIGLGRVGSRVAQIAQSFGITVLAFDPYRDEEWFQSHGVTRVGFHELLLQADIVSMHVPKTAETKNMISVRHLDFIERGIYLINTSRGDVIEPQFIERGLQFGQLLGVGLDVHFVEPVPKDTSYLKHPRCVVTPHIGGWTKQAIRKASQEAIFKLKKFINGEPILDTLPPKDPWYHSPFRHIDP
ncbi:MAG: phosphoglycerate dehydrogenase, partial [Bdellovibrionaceae bacterium]|nr:phosphoglycerate dehydrogenase [Pseudobdellovibrionaceae bacterium]MDW8191237.1 NAD(P)-dependent oxidoreductase [Pseudobdellovibrionaceae bacterium]